MESFEFELLIPIVLFLSIAFVVGLALSLRARHREQVQVTVRQAIDRGQELTPELLEQLGQTGNARQSDLRRGVIAAALGVGVGAFGLVLGEPDAVRPMLAIGAVPLLIGLAYLGLWRFGESER